MKWLTLAQIKAQLRIDGNSDDDLLTMYGEAAEDTLLNYLNKTYDEVIEAYTTMPAPLVQASLMLVDVSYQYRSPLSPTNMYYVPYTFDVLIKPYMRLADKIETA